MPQIASAVSKWLFAAGMLSGFLGGGLNFPALAAEAAPNFAPDRSTAWIPDRPTGDDFLPPLSGPGPVMSAKDHPYVPNGRGAQPTYRVADLSNPILQPWIIEKMKKANDDVLAGKIPFITRERCWPAGVPGFTVYTRVQGLYFLQTPTEVTLISELNHQPRHIYLNVPHSQNPKPSWYGESVGHYENGDTLVVDTIGFNDRVIDNYRTPRTTQLHVIERWKISSDGNAVDVSVYVEDPGVFTTPWRAMHRWRRVQQPYVEHYCAENNNNPITDSKLVPMPQATKPDF